MINSVVQEVCRALGESFADIKIYREFVEQGFEKPCFCVSAVNVEDSLFRGERYFFKAEIQVRYYSVKDMKYKSFENIERLWDILGVINSEDIGPVRGINMKSSIDDECFLFNVEYSFFYIKQEEKDLMGSVNLNIEL